MKEQSRHYLAHEYFNRDWHPMSFARMAEWLSAAKLGFTCSAHYSDHVDAVNLSTEQQALLRELPDAAFRQSVRDFMCNTQFRRDYWVKGERQLGTFDRGEQLRAQRVMLTTEKTSVELKVGVLAERRHSTRMFTDLYWICWQIINRAVSPNRA